MTQPSETQMNDEVVELLRECREYLMSWSICKEGNRCKDIVNRIDALLAQPKAAQASAAPDSGMPEAEFYETQVGASLYKLNPDRKTVSQAMLAAGDDDSLEMVLASDYDRLRAYALSLREREGMVMVPRWTVLFNDAFGKLRLYAFFWSEEAAEVVYQSASAAGLFPTKRPFHKTDSIQLAAAPAAGEGGA